MTPTEPSASPQTPTNIVDQILADIGIPHDRARLSGMNADTTEGKIAGGETSAAEDILPGETWTHPALELLPADDWAHTFFAAYVGPHGLGALSRSARKAGVTPKVINDRAADDLPFRAALDAAREELLDAFEYVLADRNLNGTLKPQYQRGILVGYVREIDNRLLQWTLERLMPEKYHLATRFEMAGADAPGAFTFAMGEVGAAETGDVLELDAAEES